MNRRHARAHGTSTVIADRTHRVRSLTFLRVTGGKRLTLLAMAFFAGALGLTACSGGATATPTTRPTVAAAQTQVSSTVTAAGSAVQGAATSVAPTVAAAQTQVSSTVTAAGSAVQGAATSVAPTVVAAQTQVSSTVVAGQTQVSSTVTAAGSAVQGAATSVAPTVAAAQTQVSSTVTAAGSAVQGAATGVAPTVAAAQTAAAPTVVAAQTQVAATRNPLSTQVVATFGPPIATSTAASPVQITAANLSQGDRTVTVRNSGTAPVNISAWTLITGNTSVVLPVDQGLRMQPSTGMTLHFSTGTDTAMDFYLGQLPQELANAVKPGDRLILVNLAGQVASIYQVA